MIEIQHLTKQYKKKELALDDINLTIEHGMFGLLGPNGAGKTTLMRILATVMPATSGDAMIDGFSLKKNPEAIRRKLGYLPQIFQLPPQLTAAEFLDYCAVMKGFNNKKERKQEILRLLEQVNLTDKQNRKIKTFSGGMKQRLGIAQALLGNPDLIIVDEPTAGLDPEERVRFRNLLARFSVNRTVILSTHIVADIESSCEQLAVLNHGQLVATGSTSDLTNHAEGKVWEVEIPADSQSFFNENQIISSRKTADGYVHKVIAEIKPSDSATLLEPTLEDGYLALIGRGANG
ncbi:ABC transporter ATP-binding protein [Pueribacillus theae]|uniref:ABC transporter ATP-binding protein n=1 Tax=Pueribacillus theae TaxID=2171751 RepID=A0A2U1JXT8_9BACI|nr:ABC transporter ATP-binding protein [Pueribacillus theae]PWA10031.1 ABC transporter ATP-binding protein [Pueribacillus theae]